MEVLTSLFSLMTSVAIAYFGIKVGNDAAEKAHNAMETAQIRAEEAHQRAERALGALEPERAERIRRGVE